MKTKITLISLLWIVFSCYSSYGQVSYIFLDDSLKQTEFMCRFENKLNQPFIIIPFYDLKEKLPDGEYIVVCINRKDSAKMNLTEHIQIKGQYKDSLRQGRFEYYGEFINKRKTIGDFYYLNHCYSNN